MGVKLGQKWAIKDGNLLASNQVGSRFFNKEFDFSRASNGTYVDRDGLLKTAELYNLIPYSEDFTQWQKLNSAVTSNLITSPSGVKNADLINYSITSSNGYIRLAHSAAQYITIYAKYKDIQWLMCYGSGLGAGKFVDIQNGVIGGNVGSGANAEIYDVGNGWKRIHFYSSSPNITQFSIYAAESDGSYASISLNGGVYLWGAQAVEGTQRDYQYTNGRVGIPRIDFSDGVGSLLLEPQRSNLLLQSNSFDTTWANVSANLTSGQSGIYGTNDAWEIERTATGARIQQSASISGINTFSVYAKAGTLNWIQIINTSSPFEGAFFDLQNGVVGTIDSDTLDASITSVGNGWYRIYFSLNFSGATNFRISPADADNDKSGTSGSIYIQHAQLESGSYPTSIIETTTTSVTRNADVCNNSGSAQDFNSEEGVLYAEIAALADDLSYRAITISDGTLDNRVTIRYRTTSNQINAIIEGSNVMAFNDNYTVSDITEFIKVALKYKSGDIALWVNGQEVLTDTSTFTITGLDTLAFDRADGSFDFYGKVRSVKYFPTALGDSKLITLTGGDGSLYGLFNSFEARVLADGGTIESQDCIINELKELL